MKESHPAEIGNGNRKGYNSNSEPNIECHVPRSGNHTVENQSSAGPQQNQAARPALPGRRPIRAHHPSPHRRRNASVTIERIETHPMSAADEKEAIAALAALLTHHQRTAQGTGGHSAPRPSAPRSLD
jgi:hypothetical protein